MSEPIFPAYRALVNGRSLFRIGSPTTFTEVQRIGSRSVVFEIAAETYPERLRIAELLAATDGTVVPIGAAEFERALEAAGNRS